MLIFLHGQYDNDCKNYSVGNIHVIHPLTPLHNGSWINYDNNDKPTKKSVKYITTHLMSLLKLYVTILGDPKKILLGGSSQGAALAMHIYSLYGSKYSELGGFIACRSEKLYDCTNVSNLKTCLSPIYFFCGMKDYWDENDTVKTTIKKCKLNYVQFLKKQNPNLTIHLEMIKNANHNEMGKREYKFIQKFLKIYK